MGTAVIGGMLAASSVDILLVPALFYLVEKCQALPRALSQPRSSAPQPIGGGLT